MKLDLPGGAHLTYCTNIHAGETLREVRHNLETLVTQVKAIVSPAAPFGVGLRLSAKAAEELEEAGELASLIAMLKAAGMYVFTINGFPYGEFHVGRVKENVYLPDWLSDARLVYTNRLASLLAELLPDDPSLEGLEGTVSTSPGAFKAKVTSEVDVASMADRLLRHAAFAHGLHQTTGKVISLALEPEPACFLETIDETVAFFTSHLFARSALERLAQLTGTTTREADEIARRHLGVCFDVCHMAVEFEDPEVALRRLHDAGIRIGKIQISAGLEVDTLTEALARFDDGVYLHQVVQRREEGLTRHLDLADAFDAATRAPSEGTYRVHFHVPLFREKLGPLKSTQPYVARVLALLRERFASAHLEVETYTWDVLPEAYRAEGIVEAVARELRWVREQLASR